MAIVLAYTVILAFYPDFGNAVIIFMLAFVVLLASGLNYVYTLILGGATVLFSFLAITFVNLTVGNFCLNISTIDLPLSPILLPMNLIQDIKWSMDIMPCSMADYLVAD